MSSEWNLFRYEWNKCTGSEMLVLTENRILPGFLSQFNVLPSSMYAVWTQHFAVQLFSPSLLLLSLPVSWTKGKKLKTDLKLFFQYWRLSFLNQERHDKTETPRQAKRVAGSFYLAIYWQIPSSHSMFTRVHRSFPKSNFALQYHHIYDQ